jgi:hypothetical protein
MAREGVEKYVEAQKKLLHLAIDQLEPIGEATGESFKAVQKEARASFAELTQKSVRNFVSAQKSLLDLAVKPVKGPVKAEMPKPVRGRARRRRAAVETHEAA